MELLELPQAGADSKPESTKDIMSPFSESARDRRLSQFRSLLPLLAAAKALAGKKKSKANVMESLSNAKSLESIRLEETLDIQNLEELMNRFKKHIPDQTALKKWLARRGSYKPIPRDRGVGKMTMQDFHNTLADMVGVEKWDSHQQATFNRQMQILFRKVDLASDGLVDWDEFCTYLMLQFQEHDSRGKRNTCPILQKPNIVKIAHNKETTTKIVKDFNPLRYVSISKEGIIGVWSTELDLQRTIEMEGCSSDDRSSKKRHVKMWITDAVSLPNVHKMAVSTTKRDIYFYDMSTPAYSPQFHLCALGNTVLCLDYYYDKKNPTKKSVLFFGDDNGSIQLIFFLTPLKGLFETPFKKTSGSHKVFFKDLSFHSRYISVVVLNQVHCEWVRRVRYYPSNDFIISCSSNGKDSLVVRGLDDKKRKTYTFKVAKGVDCFDYCKKQNAIATGGVDHAVRLWDLYVTSKPMAIMKGHQSSVIDLAIHGKLGHVLSYDKDGVLKAWDIKEHTCLQTMSIKFPFGHRYPEHGPFPFFLMESSINSLLITSNDYIAEIKLAGLTPTKSSKTTHTTPLCGALYNPEMSQVITACEGSVICFWSLDTGRKVMELTDAHGSEEISCMTLDPTNGRLFTGTREGSIHVWNASNGHMLNKLEPVEEAEVTSILSFPEKHKLLTVGWHRKIVMYNDDVETFTVKPDMSWKGGQVHQDDILTADFCLPNYIATASFDGDLNLWSLDRQKILRRIKKGAGSLFKAKMKKVRLMGKYDSFAKKGGGSWQTERPTSVPIDKVLFLTARAQWKCQESAILISSQAGRLEFWSTYGVNTPMGSFYAASEEDSTVLALATDHEDNVLITGDSKGRIALWDISNYCIRKTEAAVIAKLWSKTQEMGAEDGNNTPEGRPPQLRSWHAHSDLLVSVEYITHKGRSYVLSASVDHTACLWTKNGDHISMFGQQNLWNLNDPKTFKCPGVKLDSSLHDQKTSIKHSASPASRASEVLRFDIPGERGDSEENELTLADEEILAEKIKSIEEKGFLPKIVVGRNGKISKTNEPEDDPYSWKSSEYYRTMSNLVLERPKTPDSWSILGEHYNIDFKRRMKTRESRRHHLGQVDTSLTTTGNNCSPFKALHLPETREYSPPKDMPVTSRMKGKVGQNSAEPFWVSISQDSMPSLPPLPATDSSLTVSSMIHRGESH